MNVAGEKRTREGVNRKDLGFEGLPTSHSKVICEISSENRVYTFLGTMLCRCNAIKSAKNRQQAREEEWSGGRKQRGSKVGS